MKKHLLPIAIAVVAAVIVAGCKKKTDGFDSDTATSYSTIDNLFKDVNKVVNDAAAENNLSGKMESTENLCAEVTITPADLTTFPKTVVVDFGNVGCMDMNGVTRKGQFTAVFTNYLDQPGAHVEVTFQNYYVNGVKLEGVYDLANTSPNSTTRSFADTVTNGKATTPDSKYCTWTSYRSSVQTAGFGTASLTDDEYTGQAQSFGVGFGGKNFNATSTNIVWRLACRYLVSGNVSILSGTDPTPILVDFGNGTCDNKYEVSYSIYHTSLVFWY